MSDRSQLSRRAFCGTLVGAGLAGVAADCALRTSPVPRPDDDDAFVLRVNGAVHRLRVPARTTLLRALRDELALTGTKDGCERGECGTCTVLVEDQPRYACMILAREVSGKAITTIEGLPPDAPIVRAFVAEDALQCGYCTPGQIMAAEGLLRRRPHADADEIRAGMSGNLCRCGAYAHIEKAVAAAQRPALPPGPAPRIDAVQRATGAACYTRDLALPGMLHAAIARCLHAHAIVRRVDTAVARAMPGVAAIITAFDREASVRVPYPWWIEDGPAMQLLDPHARYAGDEVAAVVAETLDQAIAAARAIAIEYAPLPFAIDAAAALAANAPRLHETGNVTAVPPYERGDVAAGMARADISCAAVYETAACVHAPLEAHASIAQWDGDEVTVWDSTQSVFNLQRQIADALALPLASVRVVSKYVGGSFGSKAELSKHTLLAILLAKRTRRPVKLALSREEAFLCVGSRPANTMRLEAGITRSGALTALRFDNTAAVGAYADEADAGAAVKQLYRCANVRVDERGVFVNAGKTRAFRGPGGVQCAWALEQMIDELAGASGADPVDLRLAAIAEDSQLEGTTYTSSGLRRCLAEGARAFGWAEARARPRAAGAIRRGVGVAAARWAIQVGGPATIVEVSLWPDGSARVRMAGADQGTGTKTICAAIVADELGIARDRVRIEHADTATVPYGISGGGSHSAMVYATAARAAAADVQRQRRPALPRGGAIVGIGHDERAPAGTLVCAFAAQFAEIEVNIATGELRVVRLLAAHDSGRVLNRPAFENQVFGGMTMGIGFALTERRILDAATGVALTANLHDYKIATALDVPPAMTCLAIDPRDTRCNSLGVKGVGEIAMIPTAPAIANAFAHATGVRVRTAPLTPRRILEHLARRT